LPLYGDIDDCDKIASGRYIQRKIEDIADKIANRQTETIKLLGARICMGMIPRRMHMNKTKSSVWLTLIGAILFLVLLWRRILQMPAERDEEDDSRNRKNRPIS
jgi:hypothetical protein